jgi:hypothetical protein
MKIGNLEPAYKAHKELLALKANFFKHVDAMVESGVAKNHNSSRIMVQAKIVRLEQELKSLGVEL